MNNRHRSLALAILAAFAAGYIARRIDAKTYEMRAIATFVEDRANRICDEDVGDGRIRAAGPRTSVDRLP